MASGDIVLNMIGRNNTSPAAVAASASLTQLNTAIDAHIAKLHGERRAQQELKAVIDETMKEQARGIQLTGRQQAGISQLIYAVDDATTVYGTTGFAGAVRAASNNLTAAASALGPWGLAIGVGVSAVTQLTLALNKNKEEVKDNTSVMEEFRKSIEAVDRASQNIGRKGSFKAGQVTSEQFVSVGAELQDKASVANQKFLSRDALAKRLEQQQIDFAVSRTSDKGNVIGGLSPEDARTFAEMGKEIERVKQEAADFNDEMRRAQSEYAKLQQELPKIQERELEAFQAAQDQADIRAERERIAAQQAEDAAINAEAQKRFDAQLALPHGLSSRGPQTLQSGSAETFRFLNQARLGASAKSSETKELEKLNRNSAEMLAALREQIRAEKEAETIEFIDF